MAGLVLGARPWQFATANVFSQCGIVTRIDIDSRRTGNRWCVMARPQMAGPLALAKFNELQFLDSFFQAADLHANRLQVWVNLQRATKPEQRLEQIAQLQMAVPQANHGRIVKFIQFQDLPTILDSVFHRI